MQSSSDGAILDKLLLRLCHKGWLMETIIFLAREKEEREFNFQNEIRWTCIVVTVRQNDGNSCRFDIGLT